jgi:hypothetical protein
MSHQESQGTRKRAAPGRKPSRPAQGTAGKEAKAPVAKPPAIPQTPPGQIIPAAGGGRARPSKAKGAARDTSPVASDPDSPSNGGDDDDDDDEEEDDDEEDEEEEDDVDDDDDDDDISSTEHPPKRPKIYLRLVSEPHDWRVGAAFHMPDVYDEIERARAAGIDVAPGSTVIVRYEPPEGRGVTPLEPSEPVVMKSIEKDGPEVEAPDWISDTLENSKEVRPSNPERYV